VSDLELIPTVLDADDARTYSRFTSRPTRCLVKVDVGLQRLGVYPEDVVLLARTLIDLPRIEFQGLYTHLDVVSDDQPYLDWQFNRFKAVLAALSEAGIRAPLSFAASSACLLCQMP
jgi:alanine racemase